MNTKKITNLLNIKTRKKKYCKFTKRYLTKLDFEKSIIKRPMGGGMYDIYINYKEGIIYKKIKEQPFLNLKIDENFKKILYSLKDKIIIKKYILNPNLLFILDDGSYYSKYISNGLNLYDINLNSKLDNFILNDIKQCISSLKIDLNKYVEKNILTGDWALHNLMYCLNRKKIYNIDIEGFYTYPYIKNDIVCDINYINKWLDQILNIINKLIMPKKIAFCFLIYENIIHEDIWNIFFKNVDTNLYNIYIHYKNNKPLKYFEKYKLDNCIETSYGSYNISLAQNLMMKKGIKSCTHFIFLSDHCIPLKNFKYIYNFLDNNYSYFNLFPDKHLLAPRYNNVKIKGQKYLKKANTNSIINVIHAKILIDNEYLFKEWFGNTCCADEICHISVLYYFNEENNIKITNYTSYSGATTFAAWHDMTDFITFPKTIKINSYTYLKIDKEELIYLLNSTCLIGRKFKKECDISLKIDEYIKCISYNIN